MMPTKTTVPHPLIDLLGRYGRVLQHAWAARDVLAGPARTADEAAFLPAALSLQETPPHPAPRHLAFALCLLFVIALAWACFGRLDVVAVAPGRIVVSDNSKTLQPLEAGVVRRVLVRNGDVVQAGQLLVELDNTQAAADGASLLEQLKAALSEKQRTAVLLEALRKGQEPQPESLTAVAGPTQQSQLLAEWADVRAKLARLQAEAARRKAEASTVRQAIRKLEASLPLVRQREADIDALARQGFMAGHLGQDRRRERIEMESDLLTQQARLAEAQAGVQEATQARTAYLAEIQRNLSERHATAATRHEQLTQERHKTEQRTRLARLTAPVTGTVQQVAVHTEGGVVTPAQVLMVIVPAEAQVSAEVSIDNKDIGFVHAGQALNIKLETFPFTRYGTVPGTVKRIVADAVVDERRGAVFPATLSLSQSTIDIDGKAIRLSPGMNVTAEIRTGSRRVIDYLLSPLQQGLAEGLRER